MAALELHCGLDHGGCVWGDERVDLLDSFDSEMQEWEEQLQDMQRKIEELYKEVEARRGAAENIPSSSTDAPNLDITLVPVSTSNDCRSNGHNGPISCQGNSREVYPAGPCCGMRNGVPAGRHNTFNHPNNYSSGTVTHHSNGFCRPDSFQGNKGQDITLDILNGYLGQGPDYRQSCSNPGPSDMGSGGKQSFYSYQDGTKQWPVTDRMLEFEELENRKNKDSYVDEARGRHVSWKDPICSKEPSPEKLLSKPPGKRRDSPPTPVLTRSANFTESLQQQDRKCPLVDKKCGGSPSVLRKFGAMLQENEGKTLVQDGTVTTVISVEPPKVQTTPVSQRKFGVHRLSAHAPVQKCPQDSPAEFSQEPWAAAGSRYVVQTGEHKSSSYSTSPSYAHTKTTHRAETGPNRKAGTQAGQWGSQAVDLQSDYRMVERILGGCAGSQYQGKGLGPDFSQGRDSKGQFLDVMKVEQQYPTNQRSSQQVSRDSSPVAARRSFSRPARPANQRPPSRWASHTPAAKVTAPSGPMHRPPSPARKAKQPLNNLNNFTNVTLYTETVIM